MVLCLGLFFWVFVVFGNDKKELILFLSEIMVFVEVLIKNKKLIVWVE